MTLARLLPALLCACADGLQPASLEGSAVHIEGLTADTWEEMFHGASPSAWLDKVRIPPQAQQVQSVQEGMLLAQQAARNIGRQMGVPYMPHDFRETMGDGSVAAIKAKAYQNFGAMKQQFSPIAGVVDYGLSQIGGQGQTVSPQEAFAQYSMMAERLGAKSLAHQLAPLLRATTPPNPSTMFNLIGSIMTTYRMPAEAVEMYQQLGRMYAGGRQPTKYEIHYLQNTTLRKAMNRTAPRPQVYYNPSAASVGGPRTGQGTGVPGPQVYGPSAAYLPGPKTRDNTGVADYYKSTSNMFIVVYQLPCAEGMTVCFALTNEFYSFQSGPGIYEQSYQSETNGGYAMAAGIATQTPWSFISTPFYLYPSNAVGHEYDLKFVPGKYQLGYANAVTVAAILKLRESSDCLGVGDGSMQQPRVDTCPLASLAISGGTPVQVYSLLEIMPMRVVGKDSLVSFYDLMKFGGPVLGRLKGELLPDWAWAGFYRQIG